jgi:hypothetical protein
MLLRPEYLSQKPEHIQLRNSWQRAAALMIEAAENNGSLKAATAQIELALSLRRDISGHDGP